MIPPKAKPQTPLVHLCPVCQRPQTKIQRQLNGTTHGSVIWVCARANDCSVGFNLSKVETWVVV